MYDWNHDVRPVLGSTGGVGDADISTKHTTSTKNQGQVVPSNINQGTLTRSHAKSCNNRFKHQGEEYPHVE
jgi:hypothetical protein